MSIKGTDISKAILSSLSAYETEVSSCIAETAKNSANKLQKLIKDKSPVLTGDYKKGWKVKKINQRSYLVHNATDWQLTHLLEEGHAIHDGMYYVQPIPHIEPARNEVEKQFIDDLEKAVKKIGC